MVCEQNSIAASPARPLSSNFDISSNDRYKYADDSHSPKKPIVSILFPNVLSEEKDANNVFEASPRK